jgi:hypothetical protein
MKKPTDQQNAFRTIIGKGIAPALRGSELIPILIALQ